jgi:hypothetical protein
MSGAQDRDPTASAEQRWWVDTGKAGSRGRADEAKAPTLIGARFFDVGYAFEQDQAKVRLTDINIKLLEEARPERGEWKILRMVPGESLSESKVRDLQTRVPLPDGARGVLVDSGRSARLIVTGEPVSERILEFRLGELSSFDCWIRGEWVREEIFRDEEHALQEAGAYVDRYLGSTQPEAF